MRRKLNFQGGRMFVGNKKEIENFTNDENFNHLMELYIKTHKLQRSDKGVPIEDYVDDGQISPIILYRTYKSQETLKKIHNFVNWINSRFSCFDGSSNLLYI